MVLELGENVSLTSERSHSISLSTDKADRTLTLEDSGVGMTRSLDYSFDQQKPFMATGMRWWRTLVALHDLAAKLLWNS